MKEANWISDVLVSFNSKCIYCFSSLLHTPTSVFDLLTIEERLKASEIHINLILHNKIKIIYINVIFFPTLWSLLQCPYSVILKRAFFPFSWVFLFLFLFLILYTQPQENLATDELSPILLFSFLFAGMNSIPQKALNTNDTNDLAHFWVLLFTGTMWSEVFFSSWQLGMNLKIA